MYYAGLEDCEQEQWCWHCWEWKDFFSDVILEERTQYGLRGLLLENWAYPTCDECNTWWYAHFRSWELHGVPLLHQEYHDGVQEAMAQPGVSHLVATFLQLPVRIVDTGAENPYYWRDRDIILEEAIAWQTTHDNSMADQASRQVGIVSTTTYQ